MKRRSEVVATRVLSTSELDNLTNAMGAYLMAQGYEPQAHTNKMLRYELAAAGRRGIYVGLFAPLNWIAPGIAIPVGGKKPGASAVVVQVTDLPFTFGVDEGPGVDITVGHAFGISAPASVFSALREMVSPYAEDLDKLKSRACSVLEGRTFRKKVPGIACDHCGTVQEVPIQVAVERVEGNTAYGPGGSTTAVCSNPACGKTFPVSWDRVVFQIDVVE